MQREVYMNLLDSKRISSLMQYLTFCMGYTVVTSEGHILNKLQNPRTSCRGRYYEFIRQLADSFNAISDLLHGVYSGDQWGPHLWKYRLRLEMLKSSFFFKFVIKRSRIFNFFYFCNFILIKKIKNKKVNTDFVICLF